MCTIPYVIYIVYSVQYFHWKYYEREDMGPVTPWCIVKDQGRSGMARSCWGILTGRWGCGPAASCARASRSGS